MSKKRGTKVDPAVSKAVDEALESAPDWVVAISLLAILAGLVVAFLNGTFFPSVVIGTGVGVALMIGVNKLTQAMGIKVTVGFMLGALAFLFSSVMFYPSIPFSTSGRIGILQTTDGLKVLEGPSFIGTQGVNFSRLEQVWLYTFSVSLDSDPRWKARLRCRINQNHGELGVLLAGKLTLDEWFAEANAALRSIAQVYTARLNVLPITPALVDFWLDLLPNEDQQSIQNVGCLTSRTSRYKDFGLRLQLEGEAIEEQEEGDGSWFSF